MRTLFNKVLVELAEQDERIWMILADLGPVFFALTDRIYLFPFGATGGTKNLVHVGGLGMLLH